MVVLRISWIVLLIVVILLTNSPIESASAARKRNLSSRDNVLRLAARNTPISFTGSSVIARDDQPAPRALRKRKLSNGKRYNNQFPKFHKRNKKYATSEI
ncbi:3250_t:CDS:2 [Funneliformis caledonium]|uniref:3250_t:CDS:1 n=1 Tax=Funneliformis caledonium TaxID=1117310 RepID=A0A9N9C3P8_9GLOM|nr:3250_t:CDS:2 [Funneliformis caledonium]